MKHEEPIYSYQIKKSFYYTLEDGTRLAADLIFPGTAPDEIADGTFPAILVASRAGRWNPETGNGDMFATYLVSHGYVASIIEGRGCGASFGTCDSFFGPQDRKDLAEYIQWLSRQDWCTGQVGMVGISNRAFAQLATATQQPEALKVITPTVAITDFYYQNYLNGVSAMPHLVMPKAGPLLTKEEVLAKVVPVDEDPQGDLAYEAYCQDQYGKNKPFVGNLLYENMNRDSENVKLGGEKTNLTVPPITHRDALAASGIHQHQFIGQLESGTLGQLANYFDMGGSFVLGPWTHFQSRMGNPNVPEGMFPFNDYYRHIMDHELKGKDNTLDQQPPVTYYQFGARDGQHWRVSDTWPLEGERRVKLYLTPETSGTAASANDGSLRLTRPACETGTEYTVDPTISVFDNHDGKGSTYNRMTMCWDGNMAEDVDAKGLTFTSQPLFPVYENVMAGCVSVDLWVSSTAPDGDFIAYMEEVFPDGTSHFIKDGVIRASHRTAAPNAAWEKMGATWHTSMTEDVDRCLAEGLSQPTHLQFAIEPIVYQFRKGSRLRLTITCADYKTYQHPAYEKGMPTITLYQGGDHASFISVPFIEHEENVYNGQVTMEGYEGPGTLYFFEKNVYLNYDGRWKRMNVAAGEADYTVKGYVAHFAAGFDFILEGDPVKDGIYQQYSGGAPRFHPMPAFRHVFVDQVEIAESSHHLFVPVTKDLKLDVFHPDRAAGALPCVVNIHGYGNSYSVFKDQHNALYEDGYVIAGIDLRNYPSNPFPDYLYDVKGAIRHLRAHAEEYGIDPNRIGCYGLSLGGNSTLMAALTGDQPEWEGTVGGNPGVSSRLQAAVAGFAWSELLYMGKDIVEEFSAYPDMVASKAARTDGDFAPAAEAISFAGKGKGLGNLRRYLEEGRAGTDPEFDAALERAKNASPVNHVDPGCPPIALYGGYGQMGVDIAMNQTLRTFRRMHDKDVTCFLFANTQGEYGRAPEVVDGVHEFLNHYLKETPAKRKLVVYTDDRQPLANAVPISREGIICREGGEIAVQAALLSEILDVTLPEEMADAEGYLTVKAESQLPGVSVRAFPEDGCVTLTKVLPPRR